MTVQREKGKIQICSEDDGIGFDTTNIFSRVMETGGSNLFGLRERLIHIGADIEVFSSRGRGTRVTLTAPI